MQILMNKYAPGIPQKAFIVTGHQIFCLELTHAKNTEPISVNGTRHHVKTNTWNILRHW